MMGRDLNLLHILIAHRRDFRFDNSRTMTSLTISVQCSMFFLLNTLFLLLTYNITYMLYYMLIINLSYIPTFAHLKQALESIE
jgi:hypothetical protein